MPLRTFLCAAFVSTPGDAFVGIVWKVCRHRVTKTNPGDKLVLFFWFCCLYHITGGGSWGGVVSPEKGGIVGRIRYYQYCCLYYSCTGYVA